MSGDDKGFASRWSKRKAEAREETATEIALEEEKFASLEEQDKPQEIEQSDDDLLTEEDFDDVDFDALDKTSDYTRFVKSNVPAAIQQKALRKLWDSDSVFEVLDGMNDYDEDFTGNGLAGKVLKTAYVVGKGFLESSEENTEENAKENIEKNIEESTEEQKIAGLETHSSESEKTTSPADKTSISEDDGFEEEKTVDSQT